MSDTQANERPLSGTTRLMTVSRNGYLVLAVVLLVAILIQVFLAGAGVLSDAGFLGHHASFMEWIQPVPVLLLLAALLGKMARKALLLPVVTWVAFFLQYQFIGLRPGLAAGLHTVNALLIFWLTLQMIAQGRKAGALKTSSGVEHERQGPSAS